MIVRRRLAIVGVLVVGSVALYAWRRQTAARATAPAWPLAVGITLDDAATTWRVVHAGDDPREPIPEPNTERIAFLSRRSRRDDAAFLATGNTYVHAAYEETRAVGEDGTAMGMWFMDYLAFERAQLDTAFAVESGPSKPAAIDLKDRAAALRALDHATRAAADAIARAHPTNGDPKFVVHLLDGARPDLDARRDASLARVLAGRGARAAEIVHVPYRASDSALPPLGVRVAAEAVVGGKLVKDIVIDDQWAELLYGRAAVANTAAPPPGVALVDAHVHLADDDDDNLIAALDGGGIRRAIVAPLPRGVDDSDLESANARVLRAAVRFPDRIVPMAMVSPRAADPAADLEALVSRGARGLKLMSGHHAYFQAAGLQLDDEKMRRVFDICDRRNLPVLWHVNSHLYSEGFLRILRDYPRVRIVNPHFGGYLTYAPAAIRTLLDAHPNLYFDVSLGERATYVRRSLEDLSYLAPIWQKLFTDYPTRFLWGTDLVITKESARSHTNATYRLYRDTYERARYDFDYVPTRGFSWPWEDGHHRQGLAGMALPEDVLRKLYAENAERVYGGGGGERGN